MNAIQEEKISIQKQAERDLEKWQQLEIKISQHHEKMTQVFNNNFEHLTLVKNDLAEHIDKALIMHLQNFLAKKDDQKENQ